MRPIIQPTKVLHPFGDPSVEIRLFGRNKGATDWNITPLGNVLPPPGSPLPEIYDQIASVVYDAGVQKVFAPRPTEFNAQLVASESLTTVHGPNYPEDPEYHLWRNFVTIHRGENADGCNVPVETAFWMSIADSPVIIAWSKRYRALICANGGLNSIVDRGKILGHPDQGRLYDSVVDTIMSQIPPENVEVRVCCGIGTEHFTHPWDNPQYGKENRAICEYIDRENCLALFGDPSKGKIDLPALIQHQFVGHGMPMSNFDKDNIDTFSDQDPTGEYTWWSSRRATTPKEKRGRNGILVIHRPY